ncbi:luciferase family oxidoreductase group 1 [Chitinophaga skermanii]|uniref:Luciferase family oxidoreductase group 1 n=1 Tax=Chitinophaga skermanii TaxID=331697 RepID=A0A327R2V9_9BACT|nr:LLM class flavin-dependent oxidoreductase [Chitinophaga skermanii]RAJ11169.1 luciferase family oxidoreductase group 1 [Chitinophaga skermanii]
MGDKKLSFLDFGYYMPPGVQATDTINAVFDLAQSLDQAGYHRYWLAEHYNDYCSWTNPEIMIAILAGYTENIKVGAAGILVHYHSAYRVASAFKMLGAIYPGRIDLGLARGGVPPETTRALLYKDAIDWDLAKSQVAEVLQYLRGLYDPEAPGALPVPPYGTDVPHAWMLGTGMESAKVAVAEDMHLCVSTFHSNKPLQSYIDTIQHYKEAYYEKHRKHGTCAVAIQMTCNDDDRRVSALLKEWNLDMTQQDNHRVIGNSAYCEDKLNEFYDVLKVDEIVIYEHNRVLEEKKESLLRLGGLILQKVV